ncbi:MAG: hypothetical protein P794_03305 [Epsilonproteobacteria bacterium (ex Lamellibrachia satsuma)]|nr:MAG: hypothetical protein P794_03305 [Epsilonproteobacteria bacterium (ex Lamellibrachia satsuma)]
MEIMTQYTYEKKWTRTSEKEALHMIEEEMPETDARATLDYILLEIQKGKTVTLGECRFKTSNNDRKN